VFRAYQPDPGRLVAVKQFRLDLPPEIAHRFVAALDRLIVADLTHLGIAAPLAAGLTDNAPYLALDFVAAESFDVVIRDHGPAPVAEALRIATQLGGALDFAAAVDVFHGTLHPRDVLVSTDDTRVTGLGVAQALEEVGLVPPVRRPYTAPERVAGGSWDRRADTFSLAALVYEMLFGRRIAGTGLDAAEAITEFTEADPGALRQLFGKALAEDPDERFETALGFAEALHTVLSQPAAPKASSPRRKRNAEESPERARSTKRLRPGLPLEPETDLPLTLVDEPLAISDVPATVSTEADAPPSLALTEVEVEQEMTPAMAYDAEPASSDQRDVEPALPSSEIARDEYGSSHSDSTAETSASPVGAVLFDRPFADLDLKLAEQERQALAESESPQSEAAEPETEPETSPARASVLGLSAAPALHTPAPPTPSELPLQSLSSVALEQSRSAVWPIALALIVGLLVGFAGGYAFFVSRERAAAAEAMADATAPDRPTSTEQQQGLERPAQATESTSPPTTSSGGELPQAPVSPVLGAPQAPTPPQPAPAQKVPAADERATPSTGRVSIRSTPAGARVSVDGRDAGVTPLTLPNLARGTHVVRLTHQGYVAAERRVRIGSTQSAQSIEVALVATRPVREAAPPAPSPERTSGSLLVDSRPTGARVLVDGKLVGTTPLLLDSVAVGDHSVRLELDGFNSWTAATRVTGGERTRVSGSLEQQ
jgi:serine/threonine protein kinase